MTTEDAKSLCERGLLRSCSTACPKPGTAVLPHRSWAGAESGPSPTTKFQGPRHAPAREILDHIPPQSCHLSSTSKTATETPRPERRGAILMPHQQSLPVCLLLLPGRGPGETPALSRGARPQDTGVIPAQLHRQHTEFQGAAGDDPAASACSVRRIAPLYGDPIDRALSCPLTSLPGQTKPPETSLCRRCPQGLSPSARTRAPAANGQGDQCGISVGSVLRQLALNTYILKTRSLLEVG